MATERAKAPTRVISNISSILCQPSRYQITTAEAINPTAALKRV
jgi:hypothetical protein